MDFDCKLFLQRMDEAAKDSGLGEITIEDICKACKERLAELRAKCLKERVGSLNAKHVTELEKFLMPAKVSEKVNIDDRGHASAGASATTSLEAANRPQEGIKHDSPKGKGSGSKASSARANSR